MRADWSNLGEIPSSSISRTIQTGMRCRGHPPSKRHILRGWWTMQIIFERYWRQSTATSKAAQTSRMRASERRPSRSTSTAIATLSTESRLIAEVLGMGSFPGSRSTSLGNPRTVVVQGATSDLPSRGIAASRESTTTGRRPMSASSHHQISPRAGTELTKPLRLLERMPGLPTRRLL